MAFTVELDEECRIQLPAELRDSLHLSPGSQVQVERDVTSDHLMLSVPESTAEPYLEWIDGVPVIAGGVPDTRGIVDQIRYMRAERAAHVMGPPWTAKDILDAEED